VKTAMISCLSVGLALAGTVPAVAMHGLSASPAHPAYIRSVAEGDFAAKKDEYMRDAKREMDEWGDKLHRAGDHAGKDVDQAWSNTKDAAGRLQSASADQWDHAKHGFESAMQGLKDRWHKIHPEDE
jgi:hypothetical protein